MESNQRPHWHSLSETEVIEFFKTDVESGLGTEDASRRLEEHGFNEVSIRKDKSTMLRFFLNFHQPLVYILLAAACVTVFLGKWVDASVIFGVVLGNAVMGFMQESKALKAIEALANIMKMKGRVIRSGGLREMPARNLVLGDIVVLRSGDKVPADIRIINEHNLYIDESNLTGESMPVEKKVGSLAPDTSLVDRTNMVFASTLVTHGEAKGVVVAIGNDAQIGRISRLVSEVEKIETPLTIKIKQFSNVLLVGIFVLVGVTFGMGVFQGHDLTENFLTAVALAVAAIPEALPAAFTVILAIGVSRMAGRNAIVRKLVAVETLGSTTIICADKTGTLTQNQMIVQEIFTGSKHYKLSGLGYSPKGSLLDFDTDEIIEPGRELKECLLAGVLCNDSSLIEEDGKWFIEGDPTEGALIVAARKVGIIEGHYLQVMPRLGSIPFESEYRYMASLHYNSEDNSKWGYVKGAAEEILDKCDRMLTQEGREVPIERERILEEMSLMARRGMRVLGFARTPLPEETVELTHQLFSSGLTFLGIQGMMDLPRPEVIDAIRACNEAGIQVKMITGDHLTTAFAIAKQLNLKIDSEHSEIRVLEGSQIAKMTQDELTKIISQISVFARVIPEQKLHLVAALQSQGHIVGMTGDGVNDAPALRKADIGISMGKSGTEVAKEASDMILTDDNFSTIKAAIEEGRCVFDNLTKFIIWTLPTNMGEAMIVVISIFAGTVLPLLPVQILWINMMTTLFLGLTLAFEKKEEDVMLRLPRDRNQPIITKPLILRILIVSVVMTGSAFFLFEWETMRGSGIDIARTVIVNVVVVCDIFYLLNCRSLKKSIISMGIFSNLWLVFGVISMIIVQLAFTYLPIFNRLFSSVPLPLESWIGIILAGLLIFGVVGLEKWIQNKFPRTKTQTDIG